MKAVHCKLFSSIYCRDSPRDFVSPQCASNFYCKYQDTCFPHRYYYFWHLLFLPANVAAFWSANTASMGTAFFSWFRPKKMQANTHEIGAMSLLALPIKSLGTLWGDKITRGNGSIFTAIFPAIKGQKNWLDKNWQKCKVIPKDQKLILHPAYQANT